jgi:hypothetical protein
MVGLTQKDAANSMLISLSGSAQVAPTQWLDWNTGVSYFVAVQTPQYRMNSIERLMSTPVAPGSTFSSSTATSLAGTANSGDASVGSGPNQASQAYGNPGAAANNPQLLSNMADGSRATSGRKSSTTTMCSRFSMCTPTSIAAIWAPSVRRSKNWSRRAPEKPAPRQQYRRPRTSQHHGKLLHTGWAWE